MTVSGTTTSRGENSEVSTETATISAIYETTICQLQPGQRGIVARIEGEATLRNHLLEMGFTRGTQIEFLRRAPLGDPIDVKLRGYRLSLREREACAVVVATEPLAATSKRFRFARK